MTSSIQMYIMYFLWLFFNNIYSPIVGANVIKFSLSGRIL